MADKCIGKLTLDITEVDKKIQELNKFLGSIGANINLEDKLSKKISAALNKLVEEAKKAGEEAQKAVRQATQVDSSGGLESTMANVSKTVKTFAREVDDAGNVTGKLVSTVTTGFNAAGDKVREFADATGQITKRTEEAVNAIDKEIDAAYRLRNEEIKADQARQESAVRVGQKREEMAAKAAQAEMRERERALRDAEKMEAELAKAEEQRMKQESAGYGEIAKIIEKANAARQKMIENANAFGEKQNLEAYKQAISDIAHMYEEMYSEMQKASTYEASGDRTEAERHRANAEAIREEIGTIEQKHGALVKEAQALDRVKEAQKGADEAAHRTDFKTEQQRTDEIERATEAYVKLLEARSKLKQEESKHGKESEEYEKSAYAVQKAEEAFKKYSDSARNAAEASERAAQAQNQLNAVESQVAQHEAVSNALERAKNAYNDLNTAVRMYNTAKRTGDETNMTYWQQQVAYQMQILNGINQEIGGLTQDAKIRQQITDLIRQAETQQNALGKATRETYGQTTDLDSAVNGLITRYMSLFAVIRLIKSTLSEMIEYVSEYYDKMNEIQIITGKSNAEIAALAETYRDMAASMSVSSLDMADAAIYFTRQGLAAKDVEDRLKNVTMYAKTANIEFTEAAELITAVVNSMGLVEQEAEDGRTAAQRVADVFLEVGDNAATSGYEIGQAMQKAAASAGAFGVSFEWLAAYIASVSETTRQEARTIGTAFNTIIARLHQIKQTGYNQEDETKVNDVAKALSKIDVALMDQYGNWRDMEDILIDISSKWDSLDDKTRSYIATTMAGVKQQNVFLALMNDMAKGLEKGSRAWELYEIAMDSAGTAEEKFAIYTDSVTASQERLTVAQEKFFSLLDASVVKDWNNFLAGVIDLITRATKAMGGLNIIIPVVIGGFTLFIAAIVKLGTAIKAAGSASIWFGNVWTKHPVLMIITGVAAAITAITTAVGLFTSSADEMNSDLDAMTAKFKAFGELLAKSKQRIEELQGTQAGVASMIEELGDNTNGANVNLNNYTQLLDDICKVSPIAKQAVLDFKNGLKTSGEAAAIVNEELEKVIANQRAIAQGAFIGRLNNLLTNNNEDSDEPSLTLIRAMSAWPEMQTTEDYYNMFAMGYLNAIDSGFPDIHGRYLASGYDMSSGTIGDAMLAGEDISQYFPALPKEIVEKYADEFKQLRNHYVEQYGMTLDEAAYRAAYSLADEAWADYGNGTRGQNIEEIYQSTIEKWVDEAISLLGYDLTASEYRSVRNKVMELLIGADDTISEDEFNVFPDRLAEIYRTLVNEGIDQFISTNDRGMDIIKLLFPDDAANKFAAYLNDSGWVAQFVDAYDQLIAAGFSNTDIREYLDKTKIDDWVNILEIVREYMRELYTQDDVSLFDNWEDLDITTLSLLNHLADLGVSFDTIHDAIGDATDIDEINVILKNLVKNYSDVGYAADEASKSISDFYKEIKTVISEIEKINEIIEAIDAGESVDLSDLLGLADAHPEILAVINDTEKLRKVLDSIRNQDRENTLQGMKDMILDNAGIAASSPFAAYLDEEHTTLRDLMETYGEEIGEYVDQTIIMLLSYTGDFGMVGQEWLESIVNGMFNNNNMDLFNRKVIDAAELIKAGWTDAGEGIATMYSSTYIAGRQATLNASGKKGLVWQQDVVVALTPITPEGDVLTPDELNSYMERLLAESTSMEDILTNDKVANGGKGLVVEISAVTDGDFDSAVQRVDGLMEFLHNLHAYLFDQPTDGKSWLQQEVEKAAEAADADWAKSNKYIEQIGEMQRAMEEGGAEAAYEVWSRYDDKMKESIAETYPELIESLYEVEKAIDDTSTGMSDMDKVTDRLGSSLAQSAKYATAKYFTGTYDAIQKLTRGTISATEAYDAFDKELDLVVKAGEDITDVEQKMADGAEVTASDVSNLASVLGVSADTILQDWDGAVALFDEMVSETGELRAAFDALNKAAFIRITGTSEADFSNIQDGLISTKNMAQETIDMLLATGQWEVDTIPLEGEAWVQDKDGSWSKQFLHGKQQILRPKGNNPYRGRGSSVNAASKSLKNYKSSESKSSSSGGGGGGGGEGSGMTEVERMLDRMSQINAIQEFQQSYYNSQKSFYSQTGQLQGVIAYSEKEIELLEEQNEVLNSNIDRINAYIEKKKAELATLSITDEAYEEVADDLDKLQQAHQEYTKQLIDNKTSIEQLTQAIKDQQDKIRSMEIDLRNVILKAIQDREKRTQDMLNAEIEMENIILDLITKRYEKERDDIIEATNRRIDLLKEESSLLDEQLRKRKEQAEEEDKLAELKELEVKYQRIVADPTRAKEALKIRQDIEDLREEMAWDAAEKEVEAQQESIDQQIESLEDYIEYVENYYEDLFEHPQKLIDEMRSILEGTDEEIIEWLKANDEEFAKSTENTQQKMVDGWQETLRQMRGILVTYWDEVEEIISRGDDYIIDFLKENSADYREAGRLQAEAYVDEWMKKLEDLRKAYEIVRAVAAGTYSVIEKPDESGGSGGGGGGGKSTGKKSGSGSIASLSADYGNNSRNPKSSGGAIGGFYEKNLMETYATGGLANYSGPAWLDGSANAPERVLSPYQTALFETMVNVLERASRISVGGMSSYGNMSGGGGSTVSVGDIVVNVDNLDTNDDYEELAQKVSTILMDRIGRTAVVGGMRINAI